MLVPVPVVGLRNMRPECAVILCDVVLVLVLVRYLCVFFFDHIIFGIVRESILSVCMRKSSHRLQ